MFTGRLRSEIPTALVSFAATSLLKLLLCYRHYRFHSFCIPVSFVVFICSPQRSLGSGLLSAGARLTELDLSDNAFGPDGVKGIEQLLKSSSCYTLKELRLNNCGMGIGGGKVRFK